MSYQFPLAVCAEMLWQNKPIDWRVSKLTEMGFAVGLWNWPTYDLDNLEKTKANFSIMNGYLRGRLADDEGVEELIFTAAKTIVVGKRLNVDRLNLHGTDLGERRLPTQYCETVTEALWLKAMDTLNRVADLADK